MKLRKLVLLMFLVAGFFLTSQLPASVSAFCEECCIASGGVCPQENRVCCTGLTCSKGSCKSTSELEID